MNSFDKKLDNSIAEASRFLIEHQHPDGYWCFELEADCTIPAEYILMMHFMGEIDEDIESKIAVYLRDHQCEDGGWSLFYGGDSEISCSVKVYYALKLSGDDPDAPHMKKARQWILGNGGASHVNMLTRYTLALFGQIPWAGVPFLPVEIMLMPRWFPFHFDKVSYWSRTVMIPLSVLYTLKPKAENPKQIHISELFSTPTAQKRPSFPIRSRFNRAILILERTGRKLEPLIPKSIRMHALSKAEEWIVQRLNGTDGLGAIFPAMINALEALSCLGYPEDHPYRVSAKKALDNLLVVNKESAYCQPCLSPVWDTALSTLSLLEALDGAGREHIFKALDWLKDRQVRDGKGDWRNSRPYVKAGGWSFQFRNEYYTDLDDTAVVAWAMYRAQSKKYRESIHRAADWICSMQSKNGGFASFDSNNTCHYLNEIPFADHGALIDPPTSDVSARCAVLLSLLRQTGRQPVLESCLEYLRKEQETDGSWFGRWGTNYIYGTWSVLDALEVAGEGPDQPHIQRAAAWLKQMQRPDGGWSEGCCTYCGSTSSSSRDWESTSFQTAWAMLGLMSAGEVDSPEVRRGAEYLIRSQQKDGSWKDMSFTAPGFPRVFYLKYHGYDKYFPLWALARFRNLRCRGTA